jgi:hypothetical protein
MKIPICTGGLRQDFEDSYPEYEGIQLRSYPEEIVAAPV